MMLKNFKNYLFEKLPERTHQAHLLMATCQNNRAHIMLQDLIRNDIKTYARDAVNIYLLGFMYKEAKDVFTYYENFTGTILYADVSLDKIKKEEALAHKNPATFNCFGVLFWTRCWFTRDIKLAKIDNDAIIIHTRTKRFRHTSNDIKRSHLVYHAEANNFVWHVQSQRHNLCSIEHKYALAGCLITQFGVERKPPRIRK